MRYLNKTQTLKRKIVAIGACVVGLLLGGIKAMTLPIEAAVPAHTETATFALG